MLDRIRHRAAAAAALCVLAGYTTFAGGAPEPGALPDWTREKLGRRVTIREDKESLWDVAEQLAEQAGLSLVLSAPTGRMGERVGIIARDVPAGEVLEALAFALKLELKVTFSGVVALRLPPGDPRELAVLRPVMPIDASRAQVPRQGEEPPAGRRRLEPAEAIERAVANPKVAERLRALGARLFPGEFNPEKRVWVLVARRDEDAPPLGHVVVSEEGEVVGMEMRPPEKEPPPAKPPAKPPERPAPAERF